MTTALNFKDGVHLPFWDVCSTAFANATAGTSLAYDSRNSDVRDPFIYYLASAALLYKYNTKNNGWLLLSTPGLGGTFAAGAGAVFVPSAGPRGAIAAGATTTSIILTTALPTAVGVNSLANRGDGVGYKIRIIGKSAGGSGLTEERTIVGNTAGTTPTIYLDSALSFTPAATDAYEFLSGKVYLFSAGALAATIISSYDVATQTYASVTNTNFIATIATDMTIVSLDEQYVPSTRAPGDGFFGNLVATASAAATITGQAASGDAGVAINEYRNFMIRIVTDVAIPTAVGQRRKIVSHTAGASPVYTVAAWSVQPSATATYVIEYSNDIIAWNGTTTVTYSYNTIADGTWSTAAAAGTSGGAGNLATQYANPSAAHAVGAMVVPSFGITLDTAKLARYSYFYYFRGGASVVCDLFDIAGAAGGAWTAAIAIGNGGGFAPTTGSSCAYDGATNLGKYGYMSSSGLQHFMRFDVLNRVLEPWAYLHYPQSTVTAGEKVAMGLFIDGTTKLSWLYTITQALATFFRVANQR
jgi:hypothetical protein